ncbi:MAG TPA: presqualene diphosphate synthase HpnD [Pseudolabrys sp.]|jgi:squalene synthase HpnD|nr:presqualene diphosphate synthase HpnD [Pseudolabrys sp.]
MNVQVANVTESPAPAANRAGGSSFYLAMRILRREQREAMFEIYSFCRAVDDIADSDAPHAQRLEGLLVWRKNIDSLYSGSIPPELGGLARAIAHYALRKDDFLAVIDGVEMDARADIRAPSFNELDLYCDRVASAVGRLSVRIFGMDDADGVALAFHLGRALQLTNILRDIDEDAAIGRLYLPQEALRKAGITMSDPASVVDDPRLGEACVVVAERARDHYTKANEIMSRCPRRVVRAPKIMGGVYRQMLEGMISRGWARPRSRVRINKPRLIWIALRHAFV